MSEALEETRNGAGAPPDIGVGQALADPDDGTVFELLANQARDRNPVGLWTTAIGGVMNTSLLWWRYPSLHWLAAGFAAVAAYGIWGLADRAAARIGQSNDRFDWRLNALAIVRLTAIPAGILAALAAAGGFMAAALANWNH